jgi:hypothetical protein
MRAQVTLTPTESKKLIAKAVVNMDVVKKALAEGIIVMHPSSSNIFIAEEILGERPNTDVWVHGVIVPKGACVSLELYEEIMEDSSHVTKAPEAYPGSWVFEKGKFSTGTSLRDLYEKMGPGDLYMKGANAIDNDGIVGIMVGNALEGGTIGRTCSASRRRGFSILFPVGLEKLIPGRIEDAAREAVKVKYDYSMGLHCGLFPWKDGIVVTEPRAIEILSGAAATVVAAGGLMGAEGAITMAIKGEDEQVKRAIEYVEQSKGAQLPQLKSADCYVCTAPMCKFPLKGKHWVSAGV